MVYKKNLVFLSHIFFSLCVLGELAFLVRACGWLRSWEERRDERRETDHELSGWRASPEEEAGRAVAVFIFNYLGPWLWLKCGERHWELVEAFIKCSSGPGETQVNVPIISGVVRRLAPCPSDSCLMHLCGPCLLTSPLEVGGRTRIAKAPTRPISGKATLQLFFTRSPFT